jgi:hypothetical protein
MAGDPKKRQKKLERRAANRKQRQKTLVKQKHRGLRERIAAAVTAPVLHSRLSETVWEGLGYALLSRQLPNGHVAFAMFLVDLSCLGVKNAFGDVVTRAEYDRMLRDIEGQYELIDMSPPDVRNLVEGAVQYAGDVGLDPHPAYARLASIFGDIDPSEAKGDFRFGGPDGKPHFLAGPNDGPERCYRILSILEYHCGQGGFHFTVPFLHGVPESLRGESRVLIEHADDL